MRIILVILVFFPFVLLVGAFNIPAEFAVWIGWVAHIFFTTIEKYLNKN